MATQFSGRVDILKTMPEGTVFDPQHGGTAPVLIGLNGDTADINAGGDGVDGDLRLRSGTNEIRIHLDGNSATLFLGSSGGDGEIYLFPSSADDINDVNQATIQLDGRTGDIKLLNSDFAEDFDISDQQQALEPGTVMVLSERGCLQASTRAYDRRVAGVLSGARGLKPGIILDKRGRDTGSRASVALAGKVYCKVDAEDSGIEVGDLLTTSHTPGHAMKATDPQRSFGAVIGKALHPLAEGRDYVAILVALQ